MNLVRRIVASRTMRYLIGPGLLAVGGVLTDWLWVAGVVVLIGWVVTGTGSWLLERKLTVEEARSYLRTLLTNTVVFLEAARPHEGQDTLRANIMLIDVEADALRIAYSTPGYERGESAQLWAQGQGCAGRAWERNEIVYAPEDVELPVRVEDIDLRDRPWNMTPEQIRATAGRVASVLSAPVYLPSHLGNVVAVFSLDDSRPLEESRLSDEEVLSAAEQVAGEVGRFLEKATLDFPPESAASV